MNKADSIKRIGELLGKDIFNGNTRLIFDGTVGLFDSEMDAGSDFYFIPVIKTSPVIYYHNREEVWKLPLSKINAHKADPNAEVLEQPTFKKYIFPLTDAECIYPVSTSQPLYAPQAFEEVKDGFTARERACIDLRVPESGSKWLDDLIIKSRQLDTDFRMIFNDVTYTK